MTDREIGAICRGAAGAGGIGGPRPFALPGAPTRFGRDRTGAWKHVRLEVHLDFPKRRIEGAATHTITALAGGLRHITLDAVGLEIQGVLADGRQIPFAHDGERLHCVLPAAVPEGETCELQVRYAGQPSHGLYFVGPDAAEPDKPVHAWTQGQDELSRFWFPCPDYPDQRVTTEVLARVPAGHVAVSNGRLVEVTSAGTEKVFHWRQEQPHVLYLVTLAVGPFVELREEADGVPCTYYVLPGREADARRSLGKTPEMIRHFNRRLGVAYPWVKYAQVCVSDFVIGGMENTSATTLTDRTLHDERAHADYSSEPLVSHELAHQWFGDLVTCRTWAHAWLNEGFATFMESVWKEAADGADEAVYYRHVQGREYLAEDGERYRRPIVARTWVDPTEIFDAHLYQKAGRVLNLLRATLAPEVFWTGVRQYLERHRGGLVETDDFRRALEDVSGRDLGAFFDQWIHHGGHPDVRVEYAWDAATSEARLSVTQTQAADEVTPHFVFTLPIVAVTAEGERTILVPLDGATRTVHARLPGEPRYLRVDPGDAILKTLDLRLPAGLLRAALTEDADPMGRIYAAQALAKPVVPGGLAAVATALRADRFWGVRAECARLLGAAQTAEALAALADAAVRETHPKARRAVADALGEWKDPVAAAALTRLLAEDPSYYVAGSAAAALGRTRQPGAFGSLEAALPRASHQDVIAAGALRGLAALRDAEALPLLRRWVKTDRREGARVGAVDGLARFGSEADERLRREVREDLEALLRDANLRVRMSAVRGCVRLRDPAAAGALRRTRDGDPEARVRREAADALRALGEADGGVRRLRDDLEAQRKEQLDLTARLARLEALLGLGPRGGSPDGAGPGRN